ncbi:hypothetical protein I4U23_025591 [Adineta vaga]|nr:hypothetical protein I4U23_025591 [Adineta vaga]
MKELSQKASIQFRWSISAAQSQEKTLFSYPPIYTARNLPTNRLTLSTKKSSPRLPMLNNFQKKTEPFISTNTNRQICPLVLNYSQLYRAQHPLTKKKSSEIQTPPFSLLIKRPSQILDASSSPDSSDSLNSINEQYIRLRTAQIRRLHVSEKNIKEAKKLYFNAACKVFVPLSSIMEVS